MGKNYSKQDKFLSGIKNFKFTQEFIRTTICGNEKVNETILISLHKGYLVFSDSEILISYPKGLLKFCSLNPLKKKLKLFFKNGEIWTLSSVTLGNLLEFKQNLQLSMRPIQLEGSCNKCEKIGKVSCKLCGSKWCKSHIRKKMILSFIGYSEPVEVCDKCSEIGLSIQGMISRLSLGLNSNKFERVRNAFSLRVSRSNHLQLV